MEEGLPRSDFNQVLDQYLITGKMREEDYYYCSDEQKMVIQELKKAYKRINKTNENSFN